MSNAGVEYQSKSLLWEHPVFEYLYGRVIGLDMSQP